MSESENESEQRSLIQINKHMKISDCITEHRLTERTGGILNRLGGAMTSAVGNQSAVQGRATFLKQKFDTYLQNSGQTATADSLIAFLKQTGYPTSRAEQVVGTGTQDAAQTPQGQPPLQQKSKRVPMDSKANTDSYEQFKGQIRQLQPAGNKSLPVNMAAGVEASIAKLAKGDKESGSVAAQKILNFAKAGYDVSGLTDKWTANSRAGERFLTQSVFISVSKMLQEHGLYWSDLKIGIRLDENVRDRVYIFEINEDTALSNDIINQAFTASVQDAFKTGMLKVGGDGQVKVATSSGRSAAPGQTSNLRLSSFDKIKDLVNDLTPSEKIELKNLLD